MSADMEASSWAPSEPCDHGVRLETIINRLELVLWSSSLLKTTFTFRINGSVAAARVESWFLCRKWKREAAAAGLNEPLLVTGLISSGPIPNLYVWETVSVLVKGLTPTLESVSRGK